MPPSLKSHLESLASSFADGVLAAIRAASIDDLLAESGSSRRARAAGGSEAGNGRPWKNGRLPRRSQEEIEATLAKVVSAVKRTKGGLRAEDIRKALGLDVREVPRVLKEGLKTKKLKAKGNKRATMYTAR